MADLPELERRVTALERSQQDHGRSLSELVKFGATQDARLSHIESMMQERDLTRVRMDERQTARDERVSSELAAIRSTLAEMPGKSDLGEIERDVKELQGTQTTIKNTAWWVFTLVGALFITAVWNLIQGGRSVIGG